MLQECWPRRAISEVLLLKQLRRSSIQLAEFVDGAVITQDLEETATFVDFMEEPEIYIEEEGERNRLLSGRDAAEYRSLEPVWNWLSTRGVRTLRDWILRPRQQPDPVTDGVTAELWETAETALNETLASIMKREESDRLNAIGGTIVEMSVLLYRSLRNNDAVSSIVDRLRWITSGTGEDNPASAMRHFAIGGGRIKATKLLSNRRVPHRESFEPDVLLIRKAENYPLINCLVYFKNCDEAGGKEKEKSDEKVGDALKGTVVLVKIVNENSKRQRIGLTKSLHDALEKQFENWESRSNELRWEIIYILTEGASEVWKGVNQCDFAAEIAETTRNTNGRPMADGGGHVAPWAGKLQYYYARIDRVAKNEIVRKIWD
ncbi:hypothetical protein TRVL_09729 [Trypanosoma vivax]|nr:hypothetical protein TRVL_09729 [Trypanosoma vivax]